MLPPSDAELLVLWHELGPNAKRIMYSIGERLVKGARQYGDFQPRRWSQEALEEGLDLCVYLTAELLFSALQKDGEAPKGESLGRSILNQWLKQRSEPKPRRQLLRGLLRRIT